jgi:putative peptide zinc metalloprotease protein
MKLTGASIIEFHILKWAKVKDVHGNTTVIRVDTDEGLIMDDKSSTLLTHLYRGHQLNTAAKNAKISLADAKEFITQAIANNFIKSVDNKPLPDLGKKISPWLSTVNKKYFTWILTPLFIVPSLITICLGLYVGILYLNFLPNYRDYYWHPNPLVAVLGIWVLNFILIFVHECAHYIATRAIGGQAKLLLSHIGTNIVAETEQYHIAIAPKQKRYATFLAGIYVDLLIVALVLLAEFVGIKYFEGLSKFHPVFMVILLLQFNAILWEFGTFYRTDVYYFLTDLFNEDDIKLDSQRFLFKKFAKIDFSILDKFKSFLKQLNGKKAELKFSGDLRRITKKQKKLYYVYFVISILGLIANMFMFATVTLPKYLLFNYLAVGYYMNSIWHMNIIEAFFAFLVFVIINDNIIVLSYLIYKDKKKNA